MVGFALGTIGEVEFSWVGLAFGLLSSVFIALYGIFVKRVSPAVDNDSW
jgi:GDP-fucose transporter C1